VPDDGTTHVAVGLWGAGGGASPYADCEDPGCWGEGGAGGFVSGTLAVTAGQTLLVLVGEGGQGFRHLPAAAFGFGGKAFKEGGGGGGLTGVFSDKVQSTYAEGTPNARVLPGALKFDGRVVLATTQVSHQTVLLVAGGGGGGGYHAGAGLAIHGGRGGGVYGGGGGIQQGGGGSASLGGMAATVSATGEDDCTMVQMQCGKNGTALFGGDGSEVSAAGGGGYYGGGAGLWFAGLGVGGGGGGSGYAALYNVSEAVLKGESAQPVKTCSSRRGAVRTTVGTPKEPST
jgi:hypothetical protein